MALAPVKKKTQTPPINADPPVLGPNKYPGPQGRPVRTRSQNWDPQAWVQANKRPERSGMKPPQPQGQGPQLDLGENSYKPHDSPMEIDNFRGDIRDASMSRYPGVPNWGSPESSGGVMRRWDGWRGGPPANVGEVKGMPGQGGEQIQGGRAIGSKPQLSMDDRSWSGQKDLYATQGGPQGAPAGGGRPGRQPLRPGMEYRPGGGQRPVGGGMQGAPQDGGMNQYQDVLRTAQDSYNQFGVGAWNPGGPMQGQDPQQMNEWRRRLMQMQQQGPMNNQYYGAF